MKIGRIYEVDQRWDRVKRLWSLETVFSVTPSEEGKKETLARLKKHRDDVNEIIIELEQEMEEESWLA